MSIKAQVVALLPPVLKMWGLGPMPVVLAGDVETVDERALLEFVGTTARRCGYSDTRDPDTIGRAWRVLTQLARDHTADQLTADLPSGFSPAGNTLGSAHFILYLRSFDSPLTASVVPTDWGRISLEEMLAFYCEQSGPLLLGLGRSTDVVFGAGKIKSSDDDWQSVLRKLSLNAMLILVVPSVSAGTSWEIEWVSINDNLRNSIFLMPPEALGGNAAVTWRDEWPQLQRWARFMGLSFPDYDPIGLLFTMNPRGSVLRSVRFGEWVGSRQWFAGLMQLTGPTTDWLGDVQRNMLSQLEVSEAESRGIDLFTLYDEIEEKRRDQIRSNLSAIGSDEDRKHYAALERLDTVIESTGLHYGTRPGQRFSEWPPGQQDRYHSPGVYTVWWGTKDLIWAGWAADLFQELSLCASGNVSQSDFCMKVFTQLVAPTLSPEIRRDLDAGLLDENKMTRFFIHKHLSVLTQATSHVADAERIARLVQDGILSLGKPRLSSMA